MFLFTCLHASSCVRLLVKTPQEWGVGGLITLNPKSFRSRRLWGRYPRFSLACFGANFERRGAVKKSIDRHPEKRGTKTLAIDTLNPKFIY